MKSTEYCRYRRFALPVLLLAAASTACLDDEVQTLCPEGKLVEDGDIQVCVPGVVTETGFLCQGLLPHRYELADQVFCANRDDLTPEEIGLILTESAEAEIDSDRVTSPPAE